MSAPTQPVDIVNRALDECGVEALGDLEEGSPAARAATRIYTPTLRQLLSGAHWNFARKEFQMVLLADYSGQNEDYRVSGESLFPVFLVLWHRRFRSARR